jgi:hypothetical protein
MGAPDSPVRHRTGTIPCPVHRHVTQPLGFGALSTVGALSSCGIRQSGAPLTSALTSAVTLFALQNRPLLQIVVAPLAHRTVWWHTGQSGEL